MPKRKPSYQARGNSSFAWAVSGILIGLFIAALFYFYHSGSVPTAVQTEQTATVPKKGTKPAATTMPSSTAPAKAAPEFDFYTVLPKGQSEVHTTANTPITTDTHPAERTAAPAAVSNASQTSNTSTIQETVPAKNTEEKEEKLEEKITKTESSTVSGTPAAQTEKEKSESSTKSNIKNTSAAGKEENKEAVKEAPKGTAKEPSKEPSPASTTSTTAHYWLQVSSAKTYPESDRMKAQLTMMGFDVSIQSYTIKGEVHSRVVMGPYPSKAVALQHQSELQKSGVPSTVIKEQ